MSQTGFQGFQHPFLALANVQEEVEGAGVFRAVKMHVCLCMCICMPMCYV